MSIIAEKIERSHYPELPTKRRLLELPDSKLQARLSNYLLIATVAIYCVMVYQIWNYLMDDALIPLRPALMWLRGHGPVYNVGDHVEGWTSPFILFWWAALLKFASIDAAIWITKITGFIIGIAGICMVRTLADCCYPGKWWIGNIAGFVLVTSESWIAGSINCLETAFVSLFLLTGIIAHLKGNDKACAVLLMLATLSRPEMVIVYPLLAILRLKRFDVNAFLFWLIPLVALEMARIHFYHDWLPNTYWAKHVDFVDSYTGGVSYLYNNLLPTMRDPAFPQLTPWMISIAAMLTFGLTARKQVPIIAVLIALSVAIASSGGDWMIDGRFCTPLQPLASIVWASIFVFFFHAAVWTFGHRGQFAVWAMTVICSVHLASITNMALPDRQYTISHLDGVHDFLWTINQHNPLTAWPPCATDGKVVIVDWIKSHVKPGSTVAEAEMGIVPLECMNYTFLDDHGLISREPTTMPLGHCNEGVKGWDAPLAVRTYPMTRWILSKKTDAIMWYNRSIPNGYRIVDTVTYNNWSGPHTMYWAVKN